MNIMLGQFNTLAAIEVARQGTETSLASNPRRTVTIDDIPTPCCAALVAPCNSGCCLLCQRCGKRLEYALVEATR